jgi:hypothetical protein
MPCLESKLLIRAKFEGKNLMTFMQKKKERKEKERTKEE